MSLVSAAKRGHVSSSWVSAGWSAHCKQTRVHALKCSTMHLLVIKTWSCHLLGPKKNRNASTQKLTLTHLIKHTAQVWMGPGLSCQLLVTVMMLVNPLSELNLFIVSAPSLCLVPPYASQFSPDLLCMTLSILTLLVLWFILLSVTRPSLAYYLIWFLTPDLELTTFCILQLLAILFVIFSMNLFIFNVYYCFPSRIWISWQLDNL